MRKFIGRIIEWFLGYNHVVRYQGVAPRQNSHVGDAGFDLYVASTIKIPPKTVIDVPTNLNIDPIDNIWFEIKARSSTFKKRNLEVQDAVIDNGYRGDLFAVVFNPGDSEVHLRSGERICQIVPHRLVPIKFMEGELSKSTRGRNGFGSSGR